MAQRDLYNLLREFQTDLSRANKGGGVKFRVTVPDTWEHRLVVDLDDIKKELRVQLAEYSRAGRKTGEIGLSREATQAAADQAGQEAFLGLQGQEFPEKKIEDLAIFYIRNLAVQFTKSVPRGYLATIKETPNGMEVIFTADPNTKAAPSKGFSLEKVGKQGPIFANLGTVFSLAKLALNREIKRQFPKINIFSSDATFQVGHVTAVAQLRAGAVLSQIAQKDITAVLGTLQLSALSDLVKSQSELIKKFETRVAYVKPQSVVANNLASKHDATILNQVREAIDKALEEMLGKDWPNQAGSNSLTQALLAELAETAVKSGAKVTGAPKRDFSSSKASTSMTVEAKLKSVTTKGNLGKIDNPFAGQQSAVSIRSLIPMLNSRLPEQVRSNMGIFGRLHNRTGRFAESTEIVDIGNNMVVTYSYMLSPYSVFEGKGVKDPRPLIERSIREIAKGIITEKFTMRRV